MYKLNKLTQAHPMCRELRRIRTVELRISQAEFAAMVGVCKDAISKHEVGMRNPSTDVMELYEAFLMRWREKAAEMRKARG